MQLIQLVQLPKLEGDIKMTYPDPDPQPIDPPDNTGGGGSADEAPTTADVKPIDPPDNT